MYLLCYELTHDKKVFSAKVDSHYTNRFFAHSFVMQARYILNNCIPLLRDS